MANASGGCEGICVVLRVVSTRERLEGKSTGFLSGWRHNKEMIMICMDLIGPISKGSTGHIKHSTPTYIFVITDPFSHMVWLECLSGKSAEELYEKFVERFLLEERCCQLMLTDQGK